MVGVLKNKKGFTLIEVLVAMALVSVVLVGAVGLAGNFYRNTVHLEKKMAADIAARNLLDRYRLALPLGQRPIPVVENSTVDMGGFTFPYRQKLTPAAQPELQRVDIKIYDTDDKTLLRELRMYVGR